MAESIRIGVLGLTHDHVWSNLDELRELPDARLVAAADPHAPLRSKIEQTLACPTYESYERLLEEQDLDAVWLFSDNRTNVQLAEMAASQGLDMMVEKPMADSLEGADRMLAAARQHSTRLMVNWPFAWWPQLQQALNLADNGQLGEIWQVKYRAAHAGPAELGCSEYFCDWLFDDQRNGGGTLLDYCCYGALLSRLTLGVPSRVYATRGRLCKENILVEDNGILVMSYPRAISLSEGSWTQIGDLSSYLTMIYGTSATLLVEPRLGGRLLQATSDHPQGIPVDVPQPPEKMRSASGPFAHCLKTGEPFTPFCQDRIGRDAQEILEAGSQSAEIGSEVSLPLDVA